MTIGVLTPLYLWIKALHIISIVAWMAALLYLPRLYVYHCDTVPGSAESERFKVMERRLLKQIMTPAMIAAWMLRPAAGADARACIELGLAGWWHVKLAAVILLAGFHGGLSALAARFPGDRNTRLAALLPVDQRGRRPCCW